MVSELYLLERRSKRLRDLVGGLVEHEEELLHEQIDFVGVRVLQHFEAEASARTAGRVVFLQRLLQAHESGQDVGQRLLHDAVLVLLDRVHGQVGEALERVDDQERVHNELLVLEVDVLVVDVGEELLLLEHSDDLESGRELFFSSPEVVFEDGELTFW